MTQYYAIDIIECPNPALLMADWKTQFAILRRQLGCQTMELYAKDESIRDAHYDLLLVCGWSSAAEVKAAPDLQGTILFQRGLISVRVESELIIQLGEHPVETSGSDCWLVNPFEIQDAQVPPVLDMWDQAKDYMVEKAGFINARLFRSRRPHDTYNLINVAQWESRRHFLDALHNQQYDRHREKSQAYSLHPSLCRAVVPKLDASSTPSPETMEAVI